jgi:membrane-bound lytic murein transglycosylase D
LRPRHDFWSGRAGFDTLTRVKARLFLACALALGGLVPAAAVRAQDAAAMEGEETAELRALRLSELEIFAGAQPLIDAGPLLTVPGVVPDALTSDAPELAETTGVTGTARDLSWLRGLTLPDIPIRWDDRVIRYLEFFRDDPRGRSLIRGWMQRVDRYGPMIRAALRREGMPEDLLYLAMIESGFDPRARSDAGAVGLWQFVSRTGEEYGLPQDHWVDMRMDPEAATSAGARYLGALHTRFGTWELAFAAYNMGYGALLRSIRKYDTNDYWQLSHLEAALPFETSLYVAKVMACAIVGRNLERFGLGDLAREAPLAWETVEVPGGTPLSLVARASSSTVAAIRALNPALRRERVPPGHEAFSIRIPREGSEGFGARWQRVRPTHPAHRPYTVRFGESLTGVARRFATTERALRELNEMTDEDEVHAGFAIVVPAVAPHDAVSEAPPVVAVPSGTFTYTDRRRVFYRAVRGDDVSEIARFFSVTTAEVRAWNALDPHAVLQDGMFVQLFVPQGVDLAQAVVLAPDEVRVLTIGSEEFYEYHVQQEGRVRLRYRVREGDTLSGIGARFGIAVGSLCRINLVPRDAVLHLGQEVVVYTTSDHVPDELRDAIEAEPEVASEGVSESASEGVGEVEGASEGEGEGDVEADLDSPAPPEDAADDA